MSGFLLDTNIISELAKPRPEPKVTTWIDATDENLLCLSVLTLGEIRKGIARVTNASRQTLLEAWLDSEVMLRFADRILPVDKAIADRWGWVMAKALQNRLILPVIDGLLAATALHHNLTLVTRNTRDVTSTGVRIFNPWES